MNGKGWGIDTENCYIIILNNYIILTFGVESEKASNFQK